MKICVLGLGYIGLPTSVLLATNGHRVVGVEVEDANRISLKLEYPKCMKPIIRLAASSPLAEPIFSSSLHQ